MGEVQMFKSYRILPFCLLAFVLCLSGCFEKKENAAPKDSFGFLEAVAAGAAAEEDA